MEPVIIRDFGIDPDRAELARLLGTSRGRRHAGGERFEEVLAGALAEAERLIETGGIYTIVRGNELQGSTIFEDLERVAFCVCTIGPGLEKRVTELSGSGEILSSVVLDAVGSAAAEAAAVYMNDRIAEVAGEEGLRTSCRASPGYGDWDITEQGSIFRLLPAERIGVTLSENFMMIPRKSVSFAVHIARSPARMRSESSCRNCDMDNCPYRITEREKT
jgi:hypothetical protein